MSDQAADLMSREAFIEVGDTLRILALLFGTLLCTPSLAAGPVYCNQSFVAEAQSRCATEPADDPCTLITWAMYEQPARCQLVGNTLVWLVGVPTGTAMDPSSGELEVIYKWVPLTKPAPAYLLAPLGVPKAPTDVRVH
jgi:hypothetical protein